MRSRPWSKNWPKNVIQELNGAEIPSSGATFGITQGLSDRLDTV